jgi:hypothetical protein
MPISVDEALVVLVTELKAVSNLSADRMPENRTPTIGCDLRLMEVMRKWWFQEHVGQHPMPDPTEMEYAPFQDAAWELAKRGILRPGPILPGPMVMGGRQNTEGDGFSLTNAGRIWVQNFDQQPPFPVDPGRFSILVQQYARRFGPGFIQRATEAAGCYRTMNYLAACAMAGAACESVLMAVAIEKAKEEAKVLRTYLARDGRRNLIKEITANTRPFLSQGIETATGILAYWRDSAAHGHVTEIGEFAAYDALSRLLRFSQFVDANWAALTAS